MYPFLELFSRQIPTYGICLFLGIAIVFMLSVKSGKKYNCSAYDLLVIGGFALLFALPSGSTLYALVTYDLEEIIHYLSKGNFDVFGGLVFYGSIIGGFFGALVGIRVAKQKLFTIEKVVLPFIPIGHAIGRIGCMLAGCCYGMQYDGPFAVYYQNSIAGASPHIGYFPVQALEALLNIVICLILLWARDKIRHKFGMISAYLMLYGATRFLLEMLRGDAIRGIYFNVSTSQWISIALFSIGLGYTLYLKFAKNKHSD